jgi:hypothetical protein
LLVTRWQFAYQCQKQFRVLLPLWDGTVAG